MATLTIRRLDDAVYERLKLRAAANHRSLEAEARVLLEERSGRHDDLIERLRASHAKYAAEHGFLPDSTEVIRRIRDEE